MTLGSCSHIWSTAPQRCEAGQHLPVPVQPFQCKHTAAALLRDSVLLKPCGKSFITTLKCSYISYNQTRDSSLYHHNACQKQDGTDSSVQKDRRVRDSLPLALFIFPESVAGLYWPKSILEIFTILEEDLSHISLVCIYPKILETF